MIRKLIRDYYLVATVLAVMAVAGVLSLVNRESFAQLVATVFGIGMAAKLAWGMVQTMRQGKYGVDLLAVTAILATLAVGEYWASLVIVLMLTGGEALEDYANHRATREISALLERAPQHAHLQTQNGLRDIAVTKVAIGDILVIKPHEVIPVDGILLKTSASIDESSLTGESLPVDHKKGDELLSGSVNGGQAIEIKALRTARDSQYQQIVELVKAASSSEAPFVRLADRYAVPFTLISFVIAGVAWAISGEALRFAQVLVVATPCPLLIGAPVAFISGMSRAAKHGIIIKTGGVLEKLATIRTVAFDKTGTLTQGEPELHAVKPQNKIQANVLLQVAASAEQQSTHVLAQALVAAARKQKINLLNVSNVDEQPGQGVIVTIKGQRVIVGKASYLQTHNIKIDTKTLAAGETAVFVARNGAFIGTITFADKLRPNSRQTLLELRQLGVRHSLMLTGDTQGTAARIADEIGISKFKAECLPADKVAAVRTEPGPVMMVGDGVNDAPVLAAADVGLAMGARGSTAASETADVVVLLDDISRVSKAVAIAKTTLRIALQSVWIGIVISVGLMLVAASGIIPAALGAGLQEIVDVVVIFNALRAHGAWSQAIKK